MVHIIVFYVISHFPIKYLSHQNYFLTNAQSWMEYVYNYFLFHKDNVTFDNVGLHFFHCCCEMTFIFLFVAVAIIIYLFIYFILKPDSCVLGILVSISFWHQDLNSGACWLKAFRSGCSKPLPIILTWRLPWIMQCVRQYYVKVFRRLYLENGA